MRRPVNIKRIGVHVLFWALYVLYYLFQRIWDENAQFKYYNALHLLTTIPMTMVLVYINLYFLMPRYFYTRKYFTYAITLFLVMLAWGLYLRYVSYKIWLPWDYTHNYEDYAMSPKSFFVPLRIIRNTLEFYPVVALTMLIKIMSNMYRNEKRMREIEAAQFSTELNYLKAQLHPHFFFNTLNSLYSLTLQRSDAAPDMVLRLSNLMHYVLYEANARQVPLQQDLDHLKHYINIEKTRFADRLDLSFHYSGPIAGKQIAPLLLLPFVENAFKHGLTHETQQAWITIDIKVQDHQLFFKAENSFKRPAAAQRTGVGLINVKRRLELAYPERHTLVIREQEGIFSADLKIMLDEEDQMRDRRR
jgi:two-component system LytT family sensor kinase